MILSYGQHLSTLSDDFQQEVTPEKMRMSQKKHELRIMACFGHTIYVVFRRRNIVVAKSTSL